MLLFLFLALALAKTTDLGCCTQNVQGAGGGLICTSGATAALCPASNATFRRAKDGNCCRLKRLACTQFFQIVDDQAVDSTCERGGSDGDTSDDDEDTNTKGKGKDKKH